MDNKQENMDSMNMLLHAAMMIFSGILLAVMVNIWYGVCLWMGAVVCFAVARKRSADEQKTE